jgi:hypothetical protein
MHWTKFLESLYHIATKCDQQFDQWNMQMDEQIRYLHLHVLLTWRNVLLRSKNILLSEYTEVQNHEHNKSISTNIVSVSLLVNSARIVGNRIENK